MNFKVLALVGAAMLGFGAFLPIVSVPKRGSMTMMQLEYAGIILLGLAAIIVALALIERTRHVVWPGIGSLVLLGYSYFRVNTEIAMSRARLGGDAGDDPLQALRDLTASSSRLEWGWGVLALGGVMVVGAGVMAWRRGSLGDGDPR